MSETTNERLCYNCRQRFPVEAVKTPGGRPLSEYRERPVSRYSVPVVSARFVFAQRALAAFRPALLRFGSTLGAPPRFARATFGAVPLRAVVLAPRVDFFALPRFVVVLFREAMAPPW